MSAPGGTGGAPPAAGAAGAAGAAAAPGAEAGVPAGSELASMFAEGGEEGHKRKRRKPRHTEKGIDGINLTAMMDMMTIILVFLIKNFAASPENNQTDKAIMQPPRSSSKIKLEPAVTITITKLGISVDDKPIATYDGMSTFRFKGEPADTSQPIDPLRERLDMKVKDAKTLADMGGKPFEGKILVIADEKTPYAFLMRVLYTAGLAQFSQYKLIVRSKSE